ncbi:hypothetical protein PGQ11_004364 [Apiospora arundinis]|uniref:Uncharacterized protein n=1 Tax=Apiospora arundinis TaxID=335852 RepID=A0ABR2J969_9PEZI
MGTYDDEKDSDEPSDAEAGDPGSSANSTEHGTLEHAQKFWFCFWRRMTANCRIRQVDEPKL